MQKSKEQKTNKVVKFLKKNLYYVILASVLILAMVFAFVFGGKAVNQTNVNESNLTIPESQIEDVSSSKVQEFQLPVLGAKVLRDFSTSEFVSWSSLGFYAVHQGVDFSGTSNTNVLAVADGKILSVETSSNRGTVVKIQHENNIVSVYASLNNSVTVKAGDKIKKGAQIGMMSNSMADEAELGVHLHFEMLKDGKLVDPNLYLNLANK